MSLEYAGNHSAVPTSSAEQLFTMPFSRPHPAAIASLIGAGITEAGLLAAWPYEDDSGMDKTLQETTALLPHVRTLNDALADKDKGSVQVFAGRDAEILYDDYAIVHADKPSTLLPASMDLWRSPAMSVPSVARGFLKTYGITPELARDSSVDFQFNDSGFHGRAGLAFRKALHTGYGLPDNRTAINLVHANPDAAGNAIANLGGAYDAAAFERTLHLGKRGMSSPGPNLVIATAIQLQPRYTGPYDILLEDNDTVTAMPSQNEVLDPSVDVPGRIVLKIGSWALKRRSSGTNLSLVHPLAAARAQHRVVSAALQHIDALSV